LTEGGDIGAVKIEYDG